MRFDALLVAGVNTIADGIARRKPAAINGNLQTFRTDVVWRRQVLGTAGVAMCSGLLAASSSSSRLPRRLTQLARQVSGPAPLFGVSIGEVEHF